MASFYRKPQVSLSSNSGTKGLFGTYLLESIHLLHHSVECLICTFHGIGLHGVRNEWLRRSSGGCGLLLPFPLLEGRPVVGVGEGRSSLLGEGSGVWCAVGGGLNRRCESGVAGVSLGLAPGSEPVGSVPRYSVIDSIALLPELIAEETTYMFVKIIRYLLL